jgi:hypothetical protein
MELTEAEGNALFYYKLLDALVLYEILSNFDCHLLWIKVVNKLELEKNKPKRKETKHQCLYKNQNNVHQVTVTKDSRPNQWEDWDSNTNLPFTKQL